MADDNFQYNEIEDENPLRKIHILLCNLTDIHETGSLNALQMRRVEEARADYAAKRYDSTDELFHELLNN